MNYHQVTVKANIKIKIFTSKAPFEIINRAEKMVLDIIENKLLRGMFPKVFQRDKSWLSYRVNKKYRLVVPRGYSKVGPYYCFSHSEFDHWVNHH